MKPRYPFHVPRLTWRCVSGLYDGVSELTKAVLWHRKDLPGSATRGIGTQRGIREGGKEEEKGQFVQKSNIVERRGPSD